MSNPPATHRASKAPAPSWGGLRRTSGASRLASALAASALAASGLAACSTYQIEPGLDLADSPASAVHGGGELVVDLQDGLSLEEARALTGLDLSWATPLSQDEALAVATVDDLEQAIDRLAELPQIEAVEPSLEFHATGLMSKLRYPNDPLYPQQWNLQKVNTPTGWRLGGGRGVTVAVIDTGVSRVADLAGTTVLTGATFVPGTTSSADDNGHGTHVAGTIAQTTDNGLGVAGIAPNARILPLKALTGGGFGKSEWIASAIDEAVDQGADVINLSLGGPRSKVIQVAAEKAAAAGVIVVAAAGNTGQDGVGWPARSPGVIGVSATDGADKLAFYSTYGTGVDIAAPGGDTRQPGGGITQDTIDSGTAGHAFKEFQGTSMATPHVAGAAAVLLAAGTGSPTAVRQLLYDSAVDLGEPGPDPRFGHGRLDLGHATHTLLLQQRAPLAALAALAAIVLTSLGGMKRRGRIAVVAALTAGGLFFLPLLPLPPTPWLTTLARPLLLWPGAVLGPQLAANPLWLSALLPALLTFVIGPTRTLGWLAAGVCAGVGVHMLHGATMGSLSPTFMPGLSGQLWLGLNGVFSLLFVVAIAGADRMRRATQA